MVAWLAVTPDEMAEARAEAESLMTDACTITRQTGRVRDVSTNDYTPTTATVYTGKCRVQTTTTRAFPQDAGDRLTFAQMPVVSVPVGTAGIASGDLVTITAAAFNPQLVDARFIVKGIQDKSQPTALRLECESTA